MGIFTPGAMALIFLEAAEKAKAGQQKALEQAAKIVEEEAKSAIGTYKYGRERAADDRGAQG